MLDEYPDRQQRLAVCHGLWRGGKATARSRREQLRYYAEFRSEISDTWLPKYKAAVQKELARQAREVVAAVAEDAPLESLQGEWAERLFQVQRPMAIEMAVEGYQLAEAEFGKTGGVAAIQAKQAETIAAFDRAELLATHLAPDVDRWLRTVTTKMSDTTLTEAVMQVDRAREAALTGAELSRTLRTALVARSKTRADLVARSATIWNYNQGAKMLYQDEGVAVLEWLVTQDDVLCEFCEPFDGRQIEITGSFVAGGETVPGSRGGSLTPALGVEHPPLHPNCVVGETPVLAPDKIAAFITPYCGPIVEIGFADGRRLTVTPNHMLLTSYGFAKAASLREGDQICHSPFGDRIVAGHPNDDGEPAPIREVIDAFAESRGVSARRVPVAPEYLHGDGRFCDGDIDVIAPDSFLNDGLDAMPSEAVRQAWLAGADTNVPPLPGIRPLAEAFLCAAATADRIMGGRRESLAFSRRGLSHPQEHGLAAGAGADTGLQETAPDGLAVALTQLSKGVFRNARSVHFADVASIELKSFTGHVYDLQTFSSLYTCNGLVASNCRCAIVPVV